MSVSPLCAVLSVLSSLCQLIQSIWWSLPRHNRRVVDNFTLPEWQSNIMAWHSDVWFEISALFGRGKSLTSTFLFNRLQVEQTTEAACWCFLSYRWTLRTVYPIVLLPTISFDNWNQQIRNRNCRTFNDAQENYLARNLYRNKTSVFITSCFVLSNRL